MKGKHRENKKEVFSLILTLPSPPPTFLRNFSVELQDSHRLGMNLSHALKGSCQTQEGLEVRLGMQAACGRMGVGGRIQFYALEDWRLGSPVPEVAGSTLVKTIGNEDVTGIWEVWASRVYRLRGQRLTN